MNSKLEVRLEAVRLAAMTEGVSPSTVIVTAREIEEYIIGDAVLPEHYDPNATMTQLVSALQTQMSSGDEQKETAED